MNKTDHGKKKCPQHITEKMFQDKLNKHFEECQSEESNIVHLFYKLGNLSTFTQDAKALNNIIQQHVKATPPLQKEGGQKI